MRRIIKEIAAKKEQELTVYHKAWIGAQGNIKEENFLDSFIAGFELAWKLSIELHNDENERSAPCRTRRTSARITYKSEKSE